MSFLFKHAVFWRFGIQKVGHWSRWSPCAVPRRPLSVVPTCGRCCMPMGPAPFPWQNDTKPLTMRLVQRKWGRLMNVLVFKNRLFSSFHHFFLGTSRFLTSTLKDFSGWVGLVVGSVYVSKSSQDFSRNRKERASVHWQAMNGWIDYYSWRWNGDHPDEWIWRWINGWMETNCFFGDTVCQSNEAWIFVEHLVCRLHRHFLETLGYSEGKAWEFGSWGISLLPSEMDDFFCQDMFNMFNVGNSWNTVVIYTLPCTVYMSICSMNSVSSSNIKTVYRYWRFSSVRAEAHTVKMPLKSAMMITLHVK